MWLPCWNGIGRVYNVLKKELKIIWIVRNFKSVSSPEEAYVYIIEDIEEAGVMVIHKLPQITAKV